MDKSNSSTTHRLSLPVTLACLALAILCADGTVTATIILPSEGEKSFGALMKTTKDVRDFFSDHCPAAFGPDGPSEEVAKDFLERR